LPDGIDPLPQVAFRQSSADAPQILAAAIEAYYGQREIGMRTIFLAGDREDFAGVRSALRIIVMSEAEIAAASKKFGPTAATRMSPVIIDQTATRAWVRLTDDSHGTTYLLVKKDGVWSALAIAAWIA
jgi:hypothetical protein